MDNATRKHLLQRHSQSGFPGSIIDVFKAYDQGIDLIGQFEQQNNMQVAETPQQQQQGLRPAHQAGNTNQSMIFPNVPPNTPFNTKGMKAPINIQKYDEQGHLVKSYENVPPGVSSLPTGPQRGTVIETPANMQSGGRRLKKDALEMFPALESLGNVKVKTDKEFTKDLTGIGDIEYFAPGQKAITYPSGARVKHPGSDKRHTVLVNPDTNDAQNVALDMLHGLAAEDPTYNRLVQEFGEALGEDDPKHFYELDRKEGLAEDGYDQYRQNYIDGKIRNLLFQGSQEDFDRAKYNSEERQQIQRYNPIAYNKFLEIESHLKSPRKKMQTGSFVDRNYLPPIAQEIERAGGFDQYQANFDQAEELKDLNSRPTISQGNFDVDEEGMIVEDNPSFLEMAANPVATARTILDPSVEGLPSQVEFDKAAGKGTVAGAIANDIVNPAAWLNYGANAVGDVGRAGRSALEGNAAEALGHLGSAGINALGVIPGISPSAAMKAGVRDAMTRRGMVGLSDWKNLTPNPYGFKEIGAKPNIFGQYPIPKDPMKMDLTAGFEKLKKAQSRFEDEGARKGLFSGDSGMQKENIGSSYIAGKGPLGKYLGRGSFGTVYEFGANPNFTVKVGRIGAEGRYGGVTPEFHKRALKFAKEPNIAVPLRVQKFDVASPSDLTRHIYGDTAPMEVSVMRNLNRQTARGALDKYTPPGGQGRIEGPSRSAYALAKRQVRALRDEGIAVDMDNPANMSFNYRTGKFDIFDLENVPQLQAKTKVEKELWDGLVGKYYDVGEYTGKVNKYIDNSFTAQPTPPKRTYAQRAGGPRKYQSAGFADRNYLPPIAQEIERVGGFDAYQDQLTASQAAGELAEAQEQEAERQRQLRASQGEIKPVRLAPPNAMAFMPPGLQYNQQAAGNYIQENPTSNPVSLTALGSYAALAAPAATARAGQTRVGQGLGKALDSKPVRYGFGATSGYDLSNMRNWEGTGQDKMERLGANAIGLSGMRFGQGARNLIYHTIDPIGYTPRINTPKEILRNIRRPESRPTRVAYANQGFDTAASKRRLDTFAVGLGRKPAYGTLQKNADGTFALTGDGVSLGHLRRDVHNSIFAEKYQRQLQTYKREQRALRAAGKPYDKKGALKPQQELPQHYTGYGYSKIHNSGVPSAKIMPDGSTRTTNVHDQTFGSMGGYELELARPGTGGLSDINQFAGIGNSQKFFNQTRQGVMRDTWDLHPFQSADFAEEYLKFLPKSKRAAAAERLAGVEALSAVGGRPVTLRTPFSIENPLALEGRNATIRFPGVNERYTVGPYDGLKSGEGMLIKTLEAEARNAGSNYTVRNRFKLADSNKNATIPRRK